MPLDRDEDLLGDIVAAARAARGETIERMADPTQSQHFGCKDCWPANADAAWTARNSLSHLEELIDESHFHVMILACPQCNQRFISVFTETIDWTGGDDPQYWTLLPITEPEADSLVQQRDSLSETKLNALGPGRRSLWRNHPKAVPARVLWGTGILVGPHD
jgi:hypothetical protein